MRSRGGSTSEFTPGYVKPKHQANPQMTLRRLPDEICRIWQTRLTAAVASSCRTCETKSWPLLRSKRCRPFLPCSRANTP
ncbi:hypothetical protein ACLB1E_22120 [Escherichia coli]